MGIAYIVSIKVGQQPEKDRRLLSWCSSAALMCTADQNRLSWQSVCMCSECLTAPR